jgi:RNA polymerase sigma-70 factor (ECF subfamily)
MPTPPRDHETSESLAEQARAGSRSAFAELVARYEAPLFNFLLMRVRTAEDAEELTQDAFLRAWRKLGLYRSEWKFSTWLFTLARHLAASRMRAPTRASAGVETAEPACALPDPHGALADTEERANLWSLAARVLTSDQRSALWLRYAEDRSVPEIAQILGRNATAVRVLLFRARATLGRHLDPSAASAAARPVASGACGAVAAERSSNPHGTHPTVS